MFEHGSTTALIIAYLWNLFIAPIDEFDLRLAPKLAIFGDVDFGAVGRIQGRRGQRGGEGGERRRGGVGKRRRGRSIGVEE